jgi:ankyrin repeat domain-containing protein 50
VPDEVRTLYKHHNEQETRPSLTDYSKLLQLIITGFSKVFLIIDALDECNESDRSGLITEIRKLPPSLHLWCTSRHLLDIEQMFNHSPKLEIRASNTDVERYLEDYIEQNRRLKKHVSSDPSLRDVITKTIVKKVNGMFVIPEAP